ncbi:---NA--- [Paramuricea clavata]|uniref:---NA n=1 Tax=Paramuricea clavata TaxID=317549 RepID=A0A6S7H8X8_PARCT|nr:---NA--- [Paramuricea clavata]
MNNLGKELSDKFVYCAYFSRVFYGPGIQKSIEVDGELLSTVEHCMYSTMVRMFVGMGKKGEAVAACEKLTANPIVVHDAIYGKRPSSIPYLIEAWHRKLLSLLSDEDQKQLQNCEFPLSPANIFKLYYMLNEYTLAMKYYTNETQSPDLIEIKISCLRLAGNELVEMDRGKEALLCFVEFLRMLQTKEGFLDKPFYDIKLFKKTAELTPFVECSFGSLLLKLERYHEAVKHFENVIKRADHEAMECTDVDKPLLDVCLRREIEASGSITIPVKVRAFYELILTYMKLNEVGKAQEVALRLENYVERFQRTPEIYLALSIVGYANKLIENKEKAAEIFVLVLEIIPGHLCSTVVRAFVEIGKKREAVAACEKLTANPVVVHHAIYEKTSFHYPTPDRTACEKLTANPVVVYDDAIHRKPPSSIIYLIETCHRELLFLLSDEDRKQFRNCEFPLSPANIFKLYYMLNEYSLALKYYPNETQSPDLIEMKMSCLRLAGNELVEMDRENESDTYFTQFVAMLQTKEEFLNKPVHAECATLAGYSFANLYYIFRSLGEMMACERGNLDGAIQCYERCLELDEDFTLGQDLVATLHG